MVRRATPQTIKVRCVVAKTHRELIAWKESMMLLAQVYRLAARLPTIERWGLASQLRRAAVSVPTNVAEGFGRQARKDFARFVTIAEGSLRELQTLLDAVILLEYMDAETLQTTTGTSNRVGFLLGRLRRSLNRPRP